MGDVVNLNPVVQEPETMFPLCSCESAAPLVSKTTVKEPYCIVALVCPACGDSIPVHAGRVGEGE